MKLAIIGGSLLKQLNRLQQPVEEEIRTPFGQASALFVTGTIDGLEVVYLNRHGVSHQIAPHQINYKANLFALKLLEVTHIIAVAAVGGITAKMSPMKCVVADQIIDYTHGRIQTYNDIKDNHVNHIDFSYPFDETLTKTLKLALKQEGIDFQPRATYGVTQGPRLETIAEIKRMKRDGCDIVGMTAMPEAALARELEMAYANLSLVVNWAAGAGKLKSGRRGQPAAVVSMDEIKQLIIEGNSIIEKPVYRVISALNR